MAAGQAEAARVSIKLKDATKAVGLYSVVAEVGQEVIPVTTTTQGAEAHGGHML